MHKKRENTMGRWERMTGGANGETRFRRYLFVVGSWIKTSMHECKKNSLEEFLKSNLEKFLRYSFDSDAIATKITKEDVPTLMKNLKVVGIAEEIIKNETLEVRFVVFDKN